MMEGVEIDGVRVIPVEVSVLEDSTKMRVIIADGKKHEVRGVGVMCYQIGALPQQLSFTTV